VKGGASSPKYYNLLLCFIQLDMHVGGLRFICAVKFLYLLTLLTYFGLEPFLHKCAMFDC